MWQEFIMWHISGSCNKKEKGSQPIPDLLVPLTGTCKANRFIRKNVILRIKKVIVVIFFTYKPPVIW